MAMCNDEVSKHEDFRNREADIQRLTELLNIKGYKLRDLQSCLREEEENLGETGFDHATFDPLLERFVKEIGTVERIKAHSTLESSLESSEKLPYQCYLEKLLIQRSNLRNMNENAVQANATEQKVAVSDATDFDFVDSPTSTSGFNDFTGENANAALFESYSHKAKDADEISEILQESHLYSHSNKKFANTSSLKEKFKMNNGDYLKHAYLSKEKVEDDDIFWLDPDFMGSTRSAGKYNVLKNRANQKSRKPIPDKFYLHRLQLSPTSKSTITSSRSNIQSSSPKTFTESAISGGDEDGPHTASEWTNKSKSANESWYEFKERCSKSPDHGSLTPRSKQRLSGSGSPFVLRDYIKTASPISVSPTKSKKNVRFSVSPSSQNTLKNNLQTSQTNYSSDSSDDEVGFEDVEFPLVKKLDRSWTNDRRSPRRRYK